MEAQLTVTSPGRVTTDGTIFVGNGWADIVVLPVLDGNGHAISWSGSPTFSVDLTGNIAALPVTITTGNMTDPTDPSTFTAGALGATYPAVMLSALDTDTAALSRGSGRYYLRSSKWGGDAFMWRRVKVETTS